MNQRVLSEGIFYGLPDQVYHADPAPEPSLSASTAKVLLKHSPMHARLGHARLNPDWKPDDWRQFDRWSVVVQGQIVHETFLLGEQAYGIVEVDAFRSNDAKAARETIWASGRVALSRPQADKVLPLVPILREQVATFEDPLPAFTAGRPEATLVWYDEEFEIWCRARPDWLRDDFSAMDDLKTSHSARPDADGFGRTAYSLLYEVQAALYVRGLKKLRPGCDPRFRFIAFELEPPYAISMCELDPVGKRLGETELAIAMELWRDCMKHGKWPGYPQRSQRIEPPAWRVKALEDGVLTDKELLDF